MAEGSQQFQSYVAQWAAEIQSLVGAVETWANNKAMNSAKDNYGNPTFDFTTAQTNLQTALAAFETNVTTVTSS